MSRVEVGATGPQMEIETPYFRILHGVDLMHHFLRKLYQVYSLLSHPELSNRLTTIVVFVSYSYSGNKYRTFVFFWDILDILYLEFASI